MAPLLVASLAAYALAAPPAATVPGSGTALANLDAGTGLRGAWIELLDLETGATRWDSRTIACFAF